MSATAPAAAPPSGLPRCPICGSHGFSPFNGRLQARCDGCLSFERTRLMWMVLDRLGLIRGGQRVLHVAPEPSLAKLYGDLCGDDYHPRDIAPERYRAVHAGTRRLDLCTDLADIPDGSYDLILHNHVLAHVACDVEHVLGELERVLAPGGHHLFSVPLRGTLTVEDLSPALSPAERKERFGQPDHYRLFGSDSLSAMLGRVWGGGAVAPVAPLELFSAGELATAAIPREAWAGVTSHAVFHRHRPAAGAAQAAAAAAAGSRPAATAAPGPVLAPAPAAAPVASPTAAAPATTTKPAPAGRAPAVVPSAAATGDAGAGGLKLAGPAGVPGPVSRMMIGLKALRRDNPWPEFGYGEVRPFFLPLDGGRRPGREFGGGRELIIEVIRERAVELMVEVGCFLCGSTLQWLQASETLTVIGVDPWDGNWAAYIERMSKDPIMSRNVYHLSEKEVAGIVNDLRVHGNFAVAMNNVRLHKGRFIPVRRRSPDALHYLHDRAIRPQMIYIDAGKERDDLDVASDLFPDAVLAGDDWLWPDATGELRMQRIVQEFAAERGFGIRSSGQSWVLIPGGAAGAP